MKMVIAWNTALTLIGGIDVIGKRKQLFGIGVVVLNRNFNLDLALEAFDQDGFMQRAVPTVKIFYKFFESAFVVVFILKIVALIFKNNANTLV